MPRDRFQKAAALTIEDMNNPVLGGPLLEDYLFHSSENYPRYKETLYEFIMTDPRVQRIAVMAIEKATKRIGSRPKFGPNIPSQIIKKLERAEKILPVLPSFSEKENDKNFEEAISFLNSYMYDIPPMPPETRTSMDDYIVEFLALPPLTGKDDNSDLLINICAAALEMQENSKMHDKIPPELIAALNTKKQDEARLEEILHEVVPSAMQDFGTIFEYLFDMLPRDPAKDFEIEQKIIDSASMQELALKVIQGIQKSTKEKIKFRAGVSPEVLSLLETLWMEQERPGYFPDVKKDNPGPSNPPEPQ